MSSKHTVLFVDGSNLYGSQFALFGPKKYLDFSLFIEEVEKRIEEKFDQIYFYASYSPRLKSTKKEQAYIKNEALFYKSVKKTPRVNFFKGYRSKTSSKEKEVDVKLAVDMVDFAHRDKYHAMYYYPTYMIYINNILEKRAKTDKSPIKINLSMKKMVKAL